MPVSFLRTALLLTSIGVLPTRTAAEWNRVEPCSRTQHDDHQATFHCPNAIVRIRAVDPHIVRVRMAPKSTFGRNFSWAVASLDGTASLQHSAEGGVGIETFSTGALTVRVQKDPFRIEVQDADGRVLAADESARGMSWRTVATEFGTLRSVRVWQAWPDGSRVYGLGEKAGPLERGDRAWTFWNTDAWAYGPTTDPLYKSIPFFIVARDGRYHGIFFDNPYRSSIDFDKTGRNVMSFGAEGGELNYYVIAGPDPKDVIRRYTALTGRMPLPPKWAIGYHQCRYSYYPESRVRELAATFRSKRIPCDVLYFDIDYMDGYRPFTWNNEWFPDPKELTDDLREQGFRTVAIIDPGIKHEPGNSIFDSGDAIDAWVTNPDGTPYVGRVWPGDTVFPDFTNPSVRDWWAGLFPPFLAECGVAGIWNDMNEPANFAGPNKTLPLNTRFHNEGEPASHRAVHNVYGMQMARATLEGLRRARPDRRPFTMTRATYAGGQRYGAAWTGDNNANWRHLRMSITMVMGLGVSGMPFVGPDIGGFNFGPSPELFARWIQVGSLLPYSRTHTACYNPPQEPWSFGPEVERISRESLERRYALLPYLYTLFEESSRTGIPVVRPLWLECPGYKSLNEDTVFMLGPNILVVPTVRSDERPYHFHLPPGVWYDWHSGLIYGEGQPVRVPTDLDHLPLFVRAGAVIPMQRPVQSTMFEADEPLIYDVWPFRESSGILYEDDGISFKHREGQFRRTKIQCRATAEEIALNLNPTEGDYAPPSRRPLVRLHGLPGPIEAVSIQSPEGEAEAPIRSDRPITIGSPSQPGEFTYDADTHTAQVRLPVDTGAPLEVRLKLGPSPKVAKSPVRIRFDANENLIHYHRSVRPAVQYDDGTAKLVVRHTGNPQILLPRLRLSADALPVMKIRLSTEHADQLGIKFATEQYPRRSLEPEVKFDIYPDGEMHEYAFNLTDATEGRWTGTVYWVMLNFPRNNRQGETIGIAEVAFTQESQ